MSTSSLNSDESKAQAACSKLSRHDLLASLAIMKGYGNALDDSFKQLKLKVNVLSTTTDQDENQVIFAEIAAIEAECAMFIARIRQTSEQLSVNLAENHV